MRRGTAGALIRESLGGGRGVAGSSRETLSRTVEGVRRDEEGEGP